MKIFKTICAVILILSAFINGELFGQYYYLNPKPTINNFNKVVYKKFSDNTSVALALGDYGTIFKSTDDGISWVDIKAPTNNHLRDGHIFNNSYYLVVGDEGTILFTEDNGFHWYPLISNTSKKISAVFFYNQNIGYACGYQTILKTTDAGQTWLIHSEIMTNYSGTSINFLTPSIGVTGGNITYRTTNGGTNWTSMSAMVNYDLKFFLNGIGIAGGDAGRVLRFTNSGGTITSIILGYSVSLFGTAILPNNKVILAGTNGFMVYSLDFGLTWDTVASRATSTIRSLAFRDSLHGIAVGDKGGIFRSTDGGMNWSRVSSGFNTLLNTVHFADTLLGITAGLNGKVFLTSNGGENWMEKESDISNAIYSAVITKNSNIFLSSENGVISKSIDIGSSWNKYFIPNNHNIYSLKFIDDNNGIGVGDDGRVIKTSNNGGDWNIINSGISTPLLSVSVIDVNKFVACGTLGKIVTTTNGGETWNYPASGTQLNLNCVSFLDENTGIIVGPAGLILRTINGGANWSKISSPTTQTLNAVSLIDTNVIIAVGINGTIIRSENRGKNWSVDLQPSPQSLRNIFTIEKSYYIVGTEGLILKNKKPDKSFFPLFLRNSNTNRNINAIKFINDKIAIAVCDGGIVLRTANGGKNWTAQEIPKIEKLLEIESFSDTSIFVLGSRGDYWKSTDLGFSWIRLPKFTTTSILKANFYNERRGAVSSSSGITRITTDGGEKWNVISNFMLIFRGIAWYGYNKICLVGNAGNIKITTDAGGIWSTTIAPFGRDFHDIVFRDSLLGIAVGKSGVIARTTNGGNNWSYTNVRTLNLNAVKFLNHDTVVAVGDYGTLQYSTNQGETWAEYDTGINFHFNDLGGKSLDQLYFVGSSGKIFSTIDPILLSNNDNDNNPLTGTGYQLFQNYPNPFNPTTTITYQIPKEGLVTLKIYDILGKEVTTLINEEKQAGKYSIEFNASKL
ncbi:MAG TPA: YCF48-related protein, partial [Ignavibacteriaceae bacterium]|nr:YCF48-related protein [Ignavibacteriaceae bacterium]